MNALEKVAYLKGLIEGMDFAEDDKVAKVLDAIVDALDEIVDTLADVEDAQDEMMELIDEIDYDLGEVERDLYTDGDEDFDFDNELYEVECPTCHDVICIDEEMLDEGEITCPSCGENLEFDLSELECDCCDCDDCDCDCE